VAQLRQWGLEERVFAYQLCPGIRGAWVKNTTSTSALTGDYSAPRRGYFRAWLRREYGEDEGKLRAAWGDPGVGFASAEVPGHAAQHATTHLHFRDAAKERPVIDYYRALAELTAERLIGFCRKVKTLTGGQALAGAFFGYLMDRAWNDCFFGAPIDGGPSTIQRSGHLGLGRVLEAPEVDFIASPDGYAFRGLGGEGLAMPPSESVRLHHKLYIYEEDSRLHNLMDPDGRNYAFEHAVAIQQRCMDCALTHAMAIWWLADYPAGTYLNHPSTEPSPFNPWLRRFQRLGEFSLHLERGPQAEVAVLIDGESFVHETLRNSFNLPGVFYQRVQGLARFGAPHDVYLLEDLGEGRLPPYKLYVFLDAWKVDPERRTAIARVVRREGRTVLGPLFHLEDPGARVLGQVVYSLGRCKPGMGVKEFGHWRSVYIAAPNIPAPVLRGIARCAGVRLYSEAGDVLHATGQLLGIHSVAGGGRTFALPERAEVVSDLYHDRERAGDADRFAVELPPASPALYNAGPRQVLEEHWLAGGL
jgi:hypothetical protein